MGPFDAIWPWSQAIDSLHCLDIVDIILHHLPKFHMVPHGSTWNSSTSDLRSPPNCRVPQHRMPQQLHLPSWNSRSQWIALASLAWNHVWRFDRDLARERLPLFATLGFVPLQALLNKPWLQKHRRALRVSQNMFHAIYLSMSIQKFRVYSFPNYHTIAERDAHLSFKPGVRSKDGAWSYLCGESWWFHHRGHRV